MADPNTMNSASLARLSEEDYKVAPGEPDVRGWTVVLGNNDNIGEVDDLIIDRSAGKVRYLEVELAKKALGLDRDRHVLVPIGSAQLDRAKKDVVLSGMNRAALLELPEYDGKGFVSGDGNTFRSHMSTEFEPKRITQAAEELRIGKRMEKTGEVRVSKRVETEHVKKTIPVQHEEVHVERRPLGHAGGSASALRDEEIVVPVMEEQVVVEKRPVVTEEVIIRKVRVPSEQIVEVDVRQEKVDIKPTSGNIRVRSDVQGRGGD